MFGLLKLYSTFAARLGVKIPVLKMVSNGISSSEIVTFWASISKHANALYSLRRSESLITLVMQNFPVAFETSFKVGGNRLTLTSSAGPFPQFALVLVDGAVVSAHGIRDL